MDAALSVLFSWQFLLFCLGLAAITYVMRTILEYYVLENPKLPGSKDSKFWTDLILPLAPLFLGSILAIVFTQYPFPEGISSFSGRLFFGLVAGLLSGLVYRVIKAFLVNRAPNVTE